MKHVFVIHSHTTFLIALSAIEKERIKVNNVLLLYCRNYSNKTVDIPYNTIEANVLYSYLYKFVIDYRFSPFRQIKYNKLVDEFVRDIVRDSYELYIPHTNYPFFQVLATNPLCRGVNLIQEGASTFLEDKFSWKIRLSNVLTFFNKRVWFQESWLIPSFLVNKMHNTYAIRDSFFSKIKCKDHVIVSFPSIKVNINIDTNKPIYIMEASAEHEAIKTEVFLEGCKYMIDKTHEDLNYIKFHPDQSKENRAKILSFFEKTKIVVLPMDIPFEMIMSSYKNLKIYGFTSSLLYFAQDLGHEVHSYKDYLTERSEKFKNYVAKMS